MSDPYAASAGERALTLFLGGAPSSFIPVAFHAEEKLSAPFLVSVDFFAAPASLAPDQYLYQSLTLKVARPGAPIRLFNGMIRRLTASGSVLRGQTLYTFEVVPKLWFLSQTSDCRVFPDASAGDIFATVFGEANLEYSLVVQNQPKKRDYTTQYNETNLLFVSRLMQEEGCFYYFSHTETTHKLIISDYNSAFPEFADAPFAVSEAGNNFDILSSFRRHDATGHASVALDDYDPATTNAPQGSSASLLSPSTKSNQGVYSWPGHTTEQGLLANRARFQAEAADAAAALYEGHASHEGFAPGGRFTVKENPVNGASNESFVVESVTHDFRDDSWVSGGGGLTYANSFTAFPAKTPWREPFTIRRPRMVGVYSAIVLAASGAEIDSGKLAQVKVRFFWDHRQSETADNAIWVRLIQPWSGNGWGWQHIPRAGTEVAVSFMYGDPDRPVVIGCFYNGAQSTPFALPSEQAKSGFRTRSTPNGSASTYSEFSVDDTKGKELVLLHAEKDLTTETENDQTLSVGHSRTVTIKQDESIAIDGNRTLDVKGTVAHTAQKSYTIVSSGDNIIVNAETASVKITGAQAIELAVGEMSTVKMSPSSITLSVGSNSVKIDPSGVAINGTMVKAAATAMLNLTGAMTEVAGDGMLTLKGGLVQLN